MKNKKKKIVVAIIGATLLTLLLVAYLNNYILFAVFSSEKIGFYEISAMRTARADAEVAVVINIEDDLTFNFPLPNGAVEFKNTEYPVNENTLQYLITPESFEHYLNTVLPLHGLEYERFGALTIIVNNANSTQVNISTSMFTRNFMRIIIHQ
jgi:hypothetical protein